MNPAAYAGLFFVTLGTLMHEVLLPRLFSVTMFYHFAFMALSVAMFGMTAGAVVVYLRPERYSTESAPEDLVRASLAFAVTLVGSVFVYLRLPISSLDGLQALPWIALSYLVVSVPFVFSGIVVAVALTRLALPVSRLYAADLLGAAAGSVTIVWALDLTDAPTASIVVAALVGVGAVCFALASGRPRYTTATVLVAALLSGFAVGHHHLAAAGNPVLRITSRAFPDMKRLYERWNSFSFVEVMSEFQGAVPPALTGWGMSVKAPTNLDVHQLPMDIDVKAGTWITRFDGDRRGLEFLRYDITNAVHQVRKDADVCVIGVGGGRDVLSALYYGQRSVFGIELNPNVLGAVTNEFGDYAGHIDRLPHVELVADEARSRLARTKRQFDILQISLIDTFAATAAGAFVLAENSLYTVEAWNLFFDRLKPDGVLSVSRYYFHQRPAEAYRMLALAVAALGDHGIQDLRAHLVLLKNQKSLMAGAAGIGTLLVSKAPWTRAELDRLAAYAKDLEFELVLTPDHAGDAVLERIASGRDLSKFYAGYAVDVSPPVDDRPFFFQMLRLRDALDARRWSPDDVNWKNLKAILVLATLLGIVVVLTMLCIVVPLALGGRRSLSRVRQAAPALAYFAALGFGFMFVEVAQMQRFSLFLGQPTYALSVVLFTLLLGGGLGSFVAGEWLRAPRGLLSGLGALVLVLLATGLLTPVLTTRFAGADTPARVAVVVALLFPAGVAMGMPFPVGMRHAGARHAPLLPWFWGINGATSVCASVIAVAVALSSGIAAAYWAGVVCYVACAALATRLALAPAR